MAVAAVAAEPRTRARIVPAGSDHGFGVVGITVTPKVRSSDVEGAYTLLEQVVPPQVGTPPHVLHRGDKAIYVVDGRLEVLLEGETHTAFAGESVIVPRGTVHSFRNVGTRPGKILVLVSPAGHEEYLEEMSRLGDLATADPARLSELMASHGVELVTQ